MPDNSDTAIIPHGAADWVATFLMSLLKTGFNALRSWATGLIENHPWALFEAAKHNDVAKLQDLLARMPQQVQGPPDVFRSRYIEYEDAMSGWTALMVAAAEGNSECMHLLLTAGAAVGHADRWGRTALHLATQNGRVPAVQRLLQANADPFIEDCKGYTTLDFALDLDPSNSANVQIVRMIEQRARFAGWLNLKVVKFAGFRRVWEKRWCLITPRRHNRRINPDDAGTYTLLIWFRSPNDFAVMGKVWLNGAESSLADSDRPEVTLTLQRNHERPADVFVVTDTHGRHSLFLRGADASTASAAALRALAALVPGPGPARPQLAGGPPPPSAPRPQPEQDGLQLPEHPPPSDPLPRHARRNSIEEDEALARRLQEEEWARANGGAAASQGPFAAGSGSLRPSQAGGSKAEANTAVAPSAPPLVPAGPPVSDDNLCVICQENEASCGFLHGSSVHKCACKSCAQLYQRPNAPKDCPMCRQVIQQVILDIF